MRITACLIAAAATAIFSLSPANAMVFGGTNLPPFSGYPDPECRPPLSKPIPPYGGSSREEVDVYNSQVDEYNMELNQYISCMKQYVENADNDRKRILEKEQDAINAVNRL